jgi:membrane-associated protease RseP (regulator of RpoE activity)
MDADQPNLPPPRNPFESPQPTLLDVAPELAADCGPPPARRVWLHTLLFFATCASTFAVMAVGGDHANNDLWTRICDGLLYSGAVMTILLCHEMGHFLQAVRYGVSCSLPYFIPFPLSFFGTFGAVIVLDPRRGDRKAIFDIGITGPLAGIVPTLFFLLLGVHWSHAVSGTRHPMWGEPWLMQYCIRWLTQPVPAGHHLLWHPFAFAGWVGLLITSINLLPIGQLDGGHILYGMFRRNAHVISAFLLALAIAISIKWMLTGWWMMLGLITFIGTGHPPTADDSVPLGAGRYVLGFLTLAFLLIGFTPVPIRLGQ